MMLRASPDFRKAADKLKSVLGVRARLALLVLIIVAPLMLDRVRTLEDTRAQQIKTASTELVKLARQSAETQHNVLTTVEVLLKATARIYLASPKQGRECALFSSDFDSDISWISSLSVVGGDGRIHCSTLNTAVGLDISDRPYFQKAKATQTFVVSDYIVSRADRQPAVLAALPLSLIDKTSDAVMLARVDLPWLSQLMSAVNARPGASMWLIDSAGKPLAASAGSDAHSDNAAVNRITNPELITQLLAARESPISFAGRNKVRSVYATVRVPGTEARLVVGVYEESVIGSIDRDIRYAYLQFFVVSLLALLGAWLAGERLIIRPIRSLAATAIRFGNGDLRMRAQQDGLPREFIPLAKAFNSMATQLADRESSLRANNNRLTVLATLDVVSGLANRRGFENRLDFEWMRAIENEQTLGLLMIDVDYFKRFNDAYGHPEGDACLRRIGDTLAAIANETGGFAARYGGEEFLLLLPDADADKAYEVAERFREAIAHLAIPHQGSDTGVVTVSVGASTIRPRMDSRVQDLIDAADSGLYVAKNRGRNQVVVHGAIEHLASVAAEAAET